MDFHIWLSFFDMWSVFAECHLAALYTMVWNIFGKSIPIFIRFYNPHMWAPLASNMLDRAGSNTSWKAWKLYVILIWCRWRYYMLPNVTGKLQHISRIKGQKIVSSINPPYIPTFRKMVITIQFFHHLYTALFLRNHLRNISTISGETNLYINKNAPVERASTHFVMLAKRLKGLAPWRPGFKTTHHSGGKVG